jgi:hypothetical protein
MWAFLIIGQSGLSNIPALPKYDLVADVGATNARFALTLDNAPGLLHIRVLACADYPSLEMAVSSHLASTDTTGLIAKACITSESECFAPAYNVRAYRLKRRMQWLGCLREKTQWHRCC